MNRLHLQEQENWQWPESTLVLAATPIGSVNDASDRLKSALVQADIIAAEDTRKLLALVCRLKLEISAKVVSCHDHNESQRATRLISEVVSGKKILFVSDAGMPTISDPGFQLVQEAVSAGVALTVIPGPSAVLTALAGSAISPRRFCFEGFPPRKATELHQYLESLKTETRTMIFFESPRRLADTLAAMMESFGPNRQACICRELTKIYEEFCRGTLQELFLKAESIKGEIVLVVSGFIGVEPNLEDLVEIVNAKLLAGERLKDATKVVAKTYGVSAKELYNQIVAKN